MNALFLTVFLQAGHTRKKLGYLFLFFSISQIFTVREVQASYFFPTTGQLLEEKNFRLDQRLCSIKFDLPYTESLKAVNLQQFAFFQESPNIYLVGPNNLATCGFSETNAFSCHIYFSKLASSPDWGSTLTLWRDTDRLCTADKTNEDLPPLLEKLGLSSCDPDGVLNLDLEKSNSIKSCLIDILIQ